MAPDRVKIGNVSVSRMILGGNPFSGFSHQSGDTDDQMVHYFTTARIKDILRSAEELGVNTHLSRADHHVMRYLLEYWDEGGTIQWLAQTCPELGSLDRAVQNGISGGATGCYIHGGSMDFLLANDQLDEVPPAIAKIRAAGLPAGIAGHNPKVFEWAEQNLDVDFYMCSYYNPAHRDKLAEHVSGTAEWFNAEDRRIMVETIRGLSKPAIHYKVMAAGRNDPKEALEFVARHLRPIDAVCVGIFPKDNPTMLADNVRLLEEALGGV